jgi:hypothetical protein
MKKILMVFTLLFLSTTGFGEICYTNISSQNFIGERQLESLSCQQKDKLTKVLSNTMFAFEVTGTACALIPHPAMKVVGLAIDIHGLLIGGLGAYVDTFDCKDDYRTRKKALEDLCYDLRLNGMTQLNCQNIKVRD